MKRLLAGAAALALLVGGTPVAAQTSGTTKVVGTCGTAAYTAGKPNYPTQDTTGLACSSASFTPAGTQDVNVKQINGTTTTTGNGVTSAGSQRVTIASDNTAFSVNATLQTQTDTVMVGGVNVKEFNGVTPLMGNGTSGTGAQRVAIASDNSALPAAGQGATGAAVPAGATYAGAVSGGNLTGLIQADTSVAINISTATTTQLVALSSGKKVYVTAWDVIAAGTGNITLEYGTGSNCGTGTTVLTGAYNLTAQAGIAKGTGLAPVLVIPASNALCALTSAAVQMSGSLAYTQF